MVNLSNIINGLKTLKKDVFFAIFGPISLCFLMVQKIKNEHFNGLLLDFIADFVQVCVFCAALHNQLHKIKLYIIYNYFICAVCV